MGARRIGSIQRKTQRKKVHGRNKKRKVRERASRDRRIVAEISNKPLPYQPWVMSWLSTLLGKRSRLITQADVDRVVAEHSATTQAA